MDPRPGSRLLLQLLQLLLVLQPVRSGATTPVTLVEMLGTDCSAPNVHCFSFDSSSASVAPTPVNDVAAVPATAKEGFKLITGKSPDYRTWNAFLMYDESRLENCRFQIGKVDFSCPTPDLGPGITEFSVKVEQLANHFKYTIEPTAPEEKFIADLLKLFKEDKLMMSVKGVVGGDEVKFTTNGDKSLSDYEELCVPPTTDDAKPDARATKAANDPNNKRKFTCDVALIRFSDIFIGAKKSAGTGVVYCSANGWRDEEGTIVGPYAKEHPYCWKNLHGIPMFSNCKQDEHHVCFAINNEGLPTGFDVISAPGTIKRGIEIDFTKPEKWIVMVAWKIAVFPKCKFVVANLIFNCDPSVDEENEEQLNGNGDIITAKGIAKVTSVEAGLVDDTYQARVEIAMKDTAESVSDYVEMYKGTPFQVSLRRESGGPINAAYKAPIQELCTQGAHAKPDVTADDAKHDAGTNLFKCEGRANNLIYLNDRQTDVSSVYCSYKGWRNDKGKLIGEAYEQQKVFCFTNDPPNPLDMFIDCEKPTKECLVVDKMGGPGEWSTKLEKTTVAPDAKKDVGIVLDMASDFEWFLTVAHVGESCKVHIGSETFLCGTAGESEEQSLAAGAVIVKRTQKGLGRREKNLMYEKYRITAKEDKDPVVDALKFYENPSYKVGLKDAELPTLLLSHGIEFFKKCKSQPFKLNDKFSKAAKKPDDSVHNKYTCPDDRYNLIFLNDQNVNIETVFCSKRGWRDETHKIVSEEYKQEQVFCYTDDPPQGIASFFGKTCGLTTTPPCFVSRDNRDPTMDMRLELDNTNDLEWFVTIAWQGLENDCKFHIGPSFEFKCAREMDDVQEIGEVKVVKIDTGKDRKIMFEKYAIRPKDEEEPVLDALRLYTNKEHQLRLTGDTLHQFNTEKKPLFKECILDPSAAPGGAKPAQKDAENPNKYTCSGRFNQVFLNDQNMFKTVPVQTPTTVFCAKRGWRADTHKLLSVYNKEKPFCYTDNPPKRLAVFEKCAAATKICYFMDNSVPPKLVPHKTDGKPAGDNPLGFELDMSDEKKWILTMVWEGFEAGCKFSFDTLTAFDCAKNKGESQTVLGVTIEKTGEGNDQYGPGNVVKYEQYTITPVNTDDSVVDALDLYKNPKYELKLAGPTSSSASNTIEFFKECQVKATPDPFAASKKAQKATQTHNKFDCSAQPLLPVIYLKDEMKGSVLYCSKRGWRMGDGSFLINFDGEQPYCYTEAAKSEMQMFTDCDSNNNRACYIFDNMPVHVRDDKDVDKLIPYRPPAALKYNLGFDLDFNGNLWTLIISYEKLDELKFQIKDLPEISIVGKNVADDLDFEKAKVKYVAKGQDGTVFFHKFTIEPKNDGDSLIDILELYEKKDYKIALHFKGKSLAMDDNSGVTFFKQGCLATTPARFTFSGVQIANRMHNKFECDSPKAIFINDEIFDGVIYCSALGWRNSDRKLIRTNAADESVYCFDLCTQEAMVVATSDTTKPVESSSEYKCLDGKAAIKANGNYYDAVKCEDNKWTGDGVSIPLAYAETTKKTELYRFNAKCFGAFLFHEGNCNTDDLKKAGGCDQPKKDADEVLSCADGYVLTYNNIIYKSLKMEKGAWKDETGTEIEKADEKKIPKCLSKCNKDNVKTTGLKGNDWTRDALYTWDQATNKGTLKCADKTDILMADFESSGQQNNYLSEWNCDAKTEWKINTGTEKKDLKSVTKKSEREVTALFFKACDDRKIVNGCKPEELECKTIKYAVNKLTCAAHEVMYLVDGDVQKVQAKPLACTADGWREEGDQNLIYKHADDKEVQIKVQCVEKCAARFREGDTKVKYSVTDYRMSCDGYDMISYTIAGGQAATTLKDLTCDKIVGWKAGAAVLIDFANGYEFKADCVTSCSDAWVKDDCAGRYKCEKPIVESDKIKCKEKGFVLNYHDPAPVYNEIVCSKESFKINEKTLPRVDINTKIPVECISNFFAFIVVIFLAVRCRISTGALIIIAIIITTAEGGKRKEDEQKSFVSWRDKELRSAEWISSRTRLYTRYMQYLQEPIEGGAEGATAPNPRRTWEPARPPSPHPNKLKQESMGQLSSMTWSNLYAMNNESSRTGYYNWTNDEPVFIEVHEEVIDQSLGMEINGNDSILEAMRSENSDSFPSMVDDLTINRIRRNDETSSVRINDEEDKPASSTSSSSLPPCSTAHSESNVSMTYHDDGLRTAAEEIRRDAPVYQPLPSRFESEHSHDAALASIRRRDWEASESRRMHDAQERRARRNDQIQVELERSRRTRTNHRAATHQNVSTVRAITANQQKDSVAETAPDRLLMANAVDRRLSKISNRGRQLHARTDEQGIFFRHNEQPNQLDPAAVSTTDTESGHGQTAISVEAIPAQIDRTPLELIDEEVSSIIYFASISRASEFRPRFQRLLERRYGLNTGIHADFYLSEDRIVSNVVEYSRLDFMQLSIIERTLPVTVRNYEIMHDSEGYRTLIAQHDSRQSAFYAVTNANARINCNFVRQAYAMRSLSLDNHPFRYRTIVINFRMRSISRFVCEVCSLCDGNPVPNGLTSVVSTFARTRAMLITAQLLHGTIIDGQEITITHR